MKTATPGLSAPGAGDAGQGRVVGRAGKGDQKQAVGRQVAQELLGRGQGRAGGVQLEVQVGAGPGGLAAAAGVGLEAARLGAEVVEDELHEEGGQGPNGIPRWGGGPRDEGKSGTRARPRP